jgi:hypothetical protein
VCVVTMVAILSFIVLSLLGLVRSQGSGIPSITAITSADPFAPIQSSPGPLHDATVHIQCGDPFGSGIISLMGPITTTSVASPPSSSSTRGASLSKPFQANSTSNGTASASNRQWSSPNPPFPANATFNGTSRPNRTARPSAPLATPSLFTGTGNTNRFANASKFLSALLFHTAAGYM